MISIAVCDDEIALLKTKVNFLLERVLTQLEAQAEITYYNDGLDLLDDFKKQNIYDIVILDIDMPLINGKELARQLRTIDSEFTLAFFTAYPEEVFSAIPIGISAFIPKCFDDEKALAALKELVSGYISKKPKYVIIDVLVDGIPSKVKLQISNIHYFQFINRNITIHTYKDSYILTERVFDKIVKEYILKGFYKISRTCIVNIAKVHEVLVDSLIMDNGDKLVVSRRAKKELLHKMAFLPLIKEI